MCVENIYNHLVMLKSTAECTQNLTSRLHEQDSGQEVTKTMHECSTNKGRYIKHASIGFLVLDESPNKSKNWYHFCYVTQHTFMDLNAVCVKHVLKDLLV